MCRLEKTRRGRAVGLLLALRRLDQNIWEIPPTHTQRRAQIHIFIYKYTYIHINIYIYVYICCALLKFEADEPQQRRGEAELSFISPPPAAGTTGINILLLGFLPCQVYGTAGGPSSSVWRRFHVVSWLFFFEVQH